MLIHDHGILRHDNVDAVPGSASFPTIAACEEMRVRPWCCLQDGTTILMEAALRGHAPVAELLLDNGADINDTDEVRFSCIE